MSKTNTIEDGLTYARDVISGEIVACELIKQACKRFKNDYERSIDDPDCPYYFDEEQVNHWLHFCNEHVKHVESEATGQPFYLEGFQVFLTMNLYGFINKRKDDLFVRRFKYVTLFIGRKNGKTLLAAAMTLYHLLYDGEGLKAYAVANTETQANLVWAVARKIIYRLPDSLKNKFKLDATKIEMIEDLSNFNTLSGNIKALDGLNPSFCVMDEVAGIKKREQLDLIFSAQGGRANYINLMITTAYTNKGTRFFEILELTKRILSGEATEETADAYFGMIYELDEGDEWTDRDVWIKANPLIYATGNQNYLLTDYELAITSAESELQFKVKHLNLWEKPLNSWLRHGDFEACETEDLKRTGELHIGIDLGGSRDLTAVAYLYSYDGKDINGHITKNFELEVKFYLPAASMSKNVPGRYLQLYQSAVKTGELVLSETETTDYDQVFDQIVEYAKDKNVASISYDAYKAGELSTRLQKHFVGVSVGAVSQSMLSLTAAVRRTEEIIINQQLVHTGTGMLLWNFANCFFYQDSNDNIKIIKGEEPELKIDGAIATIISMSVAMTVKKSSGLGVVLTK